MPGPVERAGLLSGRGGPFRDAAFPIGTALLAALLRIGYALLEPTKRWNDSETYRRSAEQLFATGRIDSDLVMPLYPAFIGIVGWDHVLAWQIVLSSLCAMLAYGVSMRLFDDRRLARVAAVLMAVEPLSIYYANQRLTETLYTFLLLLAVWLLLARRHAAGYAAFVLSLLVRPTLDVVGPVLVVAACWAEPAPLAWRVLARRLATFGLIYVVLMAPWWLHNQQKYGRWVRLDLGDGIVARVENNPLFVRHGFWGELRPIFSEFDAIRDPVAKNDAYRRAAVAFVAEDPLRFLAMGVRRLGRFYSPVIDQGEHFASRRTRWLAFPISLLIVGAAALYAIRRKPPGELRRLAPLLVIIVSLTLVHTLVHGIVRYRVPLMPLLAVLASAGVCRLIASRRAGAG